MDIPHSLSREQDLDQTNFKMEDIKRIYGLCPKCGKGYLIKEVLYDGFIFNRRKVLIFLCPFCVFKNIHILKINENQYQKECQECGGIPY